MGYGAVRILFALAILKVVGQPLLDVLNTLMSHELIEDPHDLLYTLANYVLSNHPLYITYFVAFYFFFWGVVDVVLSYNLLHRKQWAFPVSFAVIGVFIGYELFRFSHTHSVILLGVTILDAAILWLIWREYEKVRRASDIV